MMIIWVGWMVCVGIAFCGVLAHLLDGEPLQPSWRETLIRRCEEQHAAIMRGDEHLGTYGDYPPVELDPLAPRRYRYPR